MIVEASKVFTFSYFLVNLHLLKISLPTTFVILFNLNVHLRVFGVTGHLQHCYSCISQQGLTGEDVVIYSLSLRFIGVTGLSNVELINLLELRAFL